MHRLVLIERDPSSYASWSSLTNKQRIPGLSVKEIVSKYQGFEGELVCFFEVKGNTTDFKKMLDECLKLNQLGSCFLLHVISTPSEMPSFLKDEAIKLGYDVGVCEEESTVYSSIFQEILFGIVDELVDYKDFLNECLLFPDRSLAKKYVEIHNEMSAQGKDVEDYMEMIIYEIWKHKG
jgi:hypothetical protein